MNELQTHAKSKKSDTEESISCDFVYMKFLEKAKYRDRKQIRGVEVGTGIVCLRIGGNFLVECVDKMGATC